MEERTDIIKNNYLDNEEDEIDVLELLIHRRRYRNSIKRNRNLELELEGGDRYDK